MMEQIHSLTAQQAQRALLSFYDLLPEEFWEGAGKPSSVELKASVEDAQEEAPAEIGSLIGSLLSKEGQELKGALAKTLLDRFATYSPLRVYIEQALEDAIKPHMAPVSLIIGAVLVALGALTFDAGKTETQHDDGSGEKTITAEWHVRFNLDKLAGVIGSLAQLAKSLPKELLIGMI